MPRDVASHISGKRGMDDHNEGVHGAGIERQQPIEHRRACNGDEHFRHVPAEARAESGGWDDEQSGHSSDQRGE
jgi:hypothetical protein